MALTRPVIAFALLKQCSELMRTDLLGGIAILIRPLITDLAGQRFSATALADRLSSTYGISIGPEVLEEFLPRFKDAGIVEGRPLSPHADEAIFCKVEPGPLVGSDEAEFQGVLDEFVNFAQTRLTNVGAIVPEDKLVEGLLSRLTNLDFVAIQAKPMRPRADGNSHKVLGPAAKEDQELERQIGDEARIDVLVASYLGELASSNPSIRSEAAGRDDESAGRAARRHHTVQLPHNFHANLVSLPLLALHQEGLGAFAQDKVHAAVRLRAAQLGDRVALKTKSLANQHFEFAPGHAVQHVRTFPRGDLVDQAHALVALYEGAKRANKAQDGNEELAVKSEHRKH